MPTSRTNSTQNKEGLQNAIDDIRARLIRIETKVNNYDKLSDAVTTMLAEQKFQDQRISTLEEALKRKSTESRNTLLWALTPVLGALVGGIFALLLGH